MDLQGTALVTGAAKRIGRRITERLAAAGMDVVIHCHTSRNEAEEAATVARKAGRKAWVVQADLADPAAADRLLDEARRATGTDIALLVNSASAFPRRRLDEMAYPDLDFDMRVNAWAPFALTRAAAHQGGTCVVNLLDTRIVDHDEAHVPYILAKKTLHELTRMCALQYAPMRVNAVAPGPILPPTGGTQKDLEAAIRATPLGRQGTMDEVADAVLFLAGAAYTTGQVLYVDGGRHLGRWKG